MAEVNSRAENANLRKIQSKLLQWELQEEPLAPLTSLQRDVIFDLSEEYKNLLFVDNESDNGKLLKVEDRENTLADVESTLQFLDWYEGLEQGLLTGEDAPYLNYWEQLQQRKNECETLLQQVDTSLLDFKRLSEEYNLVSTKTNALHSVSEQLLADQMKLHFISEEIKKKLYFYAQVEKLSQLLSSPTLSVSSEAFFTILSKIDECMDYLKSNMNYKESHVYLVKYRHCLSRAVGLIRSYVNHVLTHATEQVLAPQLLEKGSNPADDLTTLNPTADTAFALFFGKFQAAAPKIKTILKEIEDRVDKSEEYANLLSECQQSYLSQRAQVIWKGVETAVKDLTGNHKGDHCTLMRSACSFLIHISQDEWDLFLQFFSKSSPLLISYLSGLCNTLYDTLRPYVIHINHLETLAELCTILKIEMLEEHVNNNPEPLSAFGRVAAQLLQDCQERLAYRAHVCLRSDVLNYKPAPGDLAYPEKLLMMEQIAISLQEPALKRSDSHTSMVSVGSMTSQEVANINSESHKYRPAASPADLHGMWYPGVRRTLATLSRLYRCLERPVFQGLSQEALTLCVTSVASAAQQISAKKTNIDGELFQIKHLLILREQIAPFQVDFTVKETTLDFSQVRNAAYGLIQKRNQLFTMNSNNALLEFLLEGTPIVKELLLDSRKEVDRQLKTSCESFIKHSTEILSAPLMAFLDNMQKPTTTQTSSVAKISPEQIAAILQETQRLIKSNLAPLQRSMQLYLANKETEFILFRPIRNNVVGNYMQLEQSLSAGSYSADDMIIISCPTAEQVSVLLSSAGLLSGNDQVLPFGSSKRKMSTVTRKRSTIESAASDTDTSTKAGPSNKENTFII